MYVGTLRKGIKNIISRIIIQRVLNVKCCEKDNMHSYTFDHVYIVVGIDVI